MEKRLISAVLLSLLVLYIWAGLTHKSSPPSALKNTQIVENNVDTLNHEKDYAKSTDLPQLIPEAKTESVLPKDEELTVLETESLKVTFSNFGGSVKEIFIKQYNEKLPVTEIGAVDPTAIFTLDKFEDNEISYSLKNEETSIVNSFKVSKSGFDIKKQINITNVSEMSKEVDININLLTIDANRMDISDKDHDKSLYEYAINAYDGIHRKNNAFKFNVKDERVSESHLLWAAFRNRYFCLINKPIFDVNGYKLEVLDDQRLNISVKKHLNLAAGESIQLESLIFAGPEIHGTLASYNLDLEKVKKFYKFGLFDLIAMAIYRFMNVIHTIIPNWGITIVLISMIIYFSMYPLTLRGMSSMKKMQNLQPEIAKIKEKYGSNPQKMNQEMMLLYKEHKINPLGGCLPFLLQMPIFIGLYQVLWRSVSFKGANFMWISDLSEPDRVFILQHKLPFIGNEINLLPILMMIIMFIQQRITTKNMVLVDPIQKQQQKMMGIIMPIFLGVIFYKFASGLTLYFTLFYVFSTFTQFHMYRKKAAK